MSFIEKHLRSEELKNMSDEELLEESQRLDIRQSMIEMEQHFRKLENEENNKSLIGKFFKYLEYGETTYIKVIEYNSVLSKKGFYCKKISIDDYSYDFMYETYKREEFELMKEITKEVYENELSSLIDKIKNEFIFDVERRV